MIELRILGTLQLSASDGRDLEALARRSKRTALLCYLAAAVPDGLQRRDPLLALFWPELDEAHARSALSQALYVLRNALGEQAIETRGDGEVGLSCNVVWCDVRAFEAALDAGRPAEALALYRGGLLDGFFLSDAPEFERWIERERERLRERAGDGAWALAETRAAAKDMVQAARWARWAAALSPADESVVRRLMSFLCGLGDRAAAVRAYEAFALRLSAEYELEPSAQTLALAEAIRRKTPAAVLRTTPDLAPSTTPAPLPAPEATRQPRPRRLAGALALVLLVSAVIFSLPVLRPSAGAATDKRIAVLPLANLTGDTTQEYFVEGLHDALLTELAKIGALSVISRTSVLGYRNSTKPVTEIARELHVDAVVEGTVVLSGDSVRINAQLIAGATDRHLWANSYVRSRRNLLLLYSDVAQAIAREVQARVTPQEHARLANTRTIDPEANDLYFRGRYYCEKWTKDDFVRGITLYHRAIDQDPTFAVAYAGLAACYTDQAFIGDAPPAEVTPIAKAAAERALELDSTLGMAHASLGWIRFVTDLDFDGPDREFRLALELSPGSSWIRSWYADYLALAGRFDESVAQKRRAIDLDPLAVNTSIGLGWDYFLARRYDDAIAQFQRTLVLQPGYWYGHLELSWAYSQKGMHGMAVAECDSAAAAAPPGEELIECGWVYGRGGRRQQALATLQRATATTPPHWINPFGVSLVQIGLGNEDRALAWLRRAARERSQYLVFLKVEPMLDPLRSDPRFQELLRQLQIRS